MRQSSRTYRIGSTCSGKCEGDRGVARDTFAHWQQKATVPALSRNEMNKPYDNRRSVFKVKVHDLIMRGCKAASPRRGFFLCSSESQLELRLGRNLSVSGWVSFFFGKKNRLIERVAHTASIYSLGNRKLGGIHHKEQVTSADKHNPEFDFHGLSTRAHQMCYDGTVIMDQRPQREPERS
jgi:hypothetical protein